MTASNPPIEPSPPSPDPSGGPFDPPSDEVARLRELLLTGGLEVLDRDGLDLGADALSYSRIFAHLERAHGVSVARASVHERIWASNEDFRREVVAATVKHLPTEVLGSHGEVVRDLILDQHRRGLGPEERVAEFSRLLVTAVYDVLADRPNLDRVQLAKAIAVTRSNPQLTDELTEALEERGRSVLAGLRSRLAQLTAGLGLRPRRDVADEGGAHEILGVAAINIFVGTFLDVRAGADEMRRPVAALGVPAGDPAPWTPLALTLVALLDLLFEAVDEPVAGGGAADIPVPSPPRTAEPPTLDIGVPSGRRPRHKLRELVVGAGVEVLLQQGLDLRPQSLSYASVFSHLDRTRGEKVYRSQIHRRIWSSHEAYWLAVLERAVRIDPALAPSTVEQLAAAAPLPAGAGEPERLEAAAERLRVLVAGETSALLASPQFQRRQAVKAALLVEGDIEPFAALRRVLHEGQRARIDHVAGAIRDQVLALGFEVRPEAGMSDDDALAVVTTVAVTLTAGAVFDQAAGVEVAGVTHDLPRPGDTGGNDPWTAPAIATWAVFRQLFRPLEPSA